MQRGDARTDGCGSKKWFEIDKSEKRPLAKQPQPPGILGEPALTMILSLPDFNWLGFVIEGATFEYEITA